MTVIRPLSFTLLLLALATGAAAQTITPPEHEWSRGTTLNVFAGAASASSTYGPLAGGAFGWELTPWVGIEASAAWLDRGAGASAFSSTLTAQVNLTRPRAAVPFLLGGAGLYLASFDSSRTDLPDFYAHRVDAGTGRTHTFTDPSFVVGGGVHLFVTPKWAIRPQVEASVVRRHAQNYVVTSVTVHVGYHFARDTIQTARRR